MKKLSLFILASSLVIQLIAQDYKKRLDSLFNAVEKNEKSLGSIAISVNGKIQYQRSVGAASINYEPSVDSRYRIGSITKTFTATLVMQLVEAKKIGLDDKLSKWYPEVPNASGITVKHMLSHRSGIYSITDDKDYLNWNTSKKTRDELLSMIYKGKPLFEPGEGAAYSNSNFILLGFILEKVTGKAYAQLLKEKITSKIPLSNTYFGAVINTSKNEVSSYRKLDKWEVEPQTDMSIPGGAGGIVSTAQDLVKFAGALFEGNLVKQTTLTEMKIADNGFGLGIFQIPFYEKAAFGHTGGIDAFSSIMAYFPKDKLAVAYCSNGEGGISTNDVIIGALSIYYGRPYQIPEFKVLDLDLAHLETLTGEYESKDIPLGIKVSIVENKLTAQATGQSAFPLEAVSKNEFKFSTAGIQMIFNTTDKTMVLKQGGKAYNFAKKVVNGI